MWGETHTDKTLALTDNHMQTCIYASIDIYTYTSTSVYRARTYPIIATRAKPLVSLMCATALRLPKELAVKASRSKPL